MADAAAYPPGVGHTWKASAPANGTEDVGVTTVDTLRSYIVLRAGRSRTNIMDIIVGGLVAILLLALCVGAGAAVRRSVNRLLDDRDDRC